MTDHTDEQPAGTGKIQSEFAELMQMTINPLDPSATEDSPYPFHQFIQGTPGTGRSFFIEAAPAVQRSRSRPKKQRSGKKKEG